jgi:hypothetical protein
MKWGIFDVGTKRTGESGGVAEFTKIVAEFTKNASEGRFALARMKNFLYICHVFST